MWIRHCALYQCQLEGVISLSPFFTIINSYLFKTKWVTRMPKPKLQFWDRRILMPLSRPAACQSKRLEKKHCHYHIFYANPFRWKNTLPALSKSIRMARSLERVLVPWWQRFEFTDKLLLELIFGSGSTKSGCCQVGGPCLQGVWCQQWWNHWLQRILGKIYKLINIFTSLLQKCSDNTLHGSREYRTRRDID